MFRHAQKNLTPAQLERARNKAARVALPEGGLLLRVGWRRQWLWVVADEFVTCSECRGHGLTGSGADPYPSDCESCYGAGVLRA